MRRRRYGYVKSNIHPRLSRGLFAAAWLTTEGESAYNADADLSFDGKIDNVDSDILAENWSTPGSRPARHYYYHYDGLGSVVALSDSAGNTVEKYAYDVYGQAVIRDVHNGLLNTSSVGNPYFFTARRFDKETDLYYYRARYYDPYTGRFLQVDVIGYEGGIDLYTYCGNNPITGLDPLGLCGDQPWYEDVWDTGKYGIGSLVGLGPEGFDAADAWGAFAVEYSRASQGVVNVFTGGLFERESGIFYETFNRQWEELGYESNVNSTAFRSGETGGRVAEAALLAAAVAHAANFNPWLGKIAPHGPHGGGPHQYPHIQIMIRTGAHTTRHIYMPPP